MGGEPVAERVQAQWRRILEHLTRPEEPDAELLRRFIERRDAEAFAEIVRRYDGLVWSQCRHLLGCEADADDAFQATFLALIRSAKKIRKSEHLGPWLHGVAYRVCMNARRASAKRARREQAAVVPEASQPIADKAWDETLAAVHDEVNQLPESLRVAFVLCYLQGKSTSGAAAELGLKLGTFSARLSRAKKAVLDALAKRGCTAVAVVASLAGITAGAPPGLANRAVNLAVSNTTVPANLLALTQGVTQMGVSKFKTLAAAIVLGVSLVAGSFGVWSAKAQTPGAGGPAGLPGANGIPAGPGSSSGLPTGAAASAAGPAWRGSPQSSAFEYKMVELNGPPEMSERELNRLGEQGWELVSVTAQATNRNSQTAYLKRQKMASPVKSMGPNRSGDNVPSFPGTGTTAAGVGAAGGPAAPGTGGAGIGPAGRASPTPGAGPGGLGGAPGRPATPGAGGAGAGLGGLPGAGGATAPSGGAAGPPRKSNIIRSKATVESVSKSWIATDQGALYAVDANTRVIRRGMPAEMSDLKPGTAIEIFFDKDAKVVTEVVIQ